MILLVVLLAVSLSYNVLLLKRKYNDHLLVRTIIYAKQVIHHGLSLIRHQPAELWRLDPVQTVIYRAYKMKVNYLKPIKAQSALPLPDSLIIKPGIYAFTGKNYAFKQDGLYRIIIPNKGEFQRIVFSKKNNPEPLLTSIAWIDFHGKADDGLSDKLLTESAKTRKLSLTCCYIANFTNYILKQHGYLSRTVHFSTLNQLNGYDDGHCMNEVYLPQLKKWVLFDIDNGVYFTHHSRQLNGEELLNYTTSGSYTLHKIANDTRGDLRRLTNHFGNPLDFYTEAINANLKHWYKRIIQSVAIQHHHIYYFVVKQLSDKKVYLIRHPAYKYLTKTEFDNLFYSQ
jgi:hypothetical protein